MRGQPTTLPASLPCIPVTLLSSSPCSWLSWLPRKHADSQRATSHVVSTWEARHFACHLHPLLLLLERLGPASCCCLCPSGVPGEAACCGPGVSVHSPVAPKLPSCPLARNPFCKLLFEAMVGNRLVTGSRACCNPQEVLGAQSPRLSPTWLVRKPQARVCFSQLILLPSRKKGSKALRFR